MGSDEFTVELINSAEIDFEVYAIFLTVNKKFKNDDIWSKLNFLLVLNTPFDYDNNQDLPNLIQSTEAMQASYSEEYIMDPLPTVKFETTWHGFAS